MNENQCCDTKSSCDCDTSTSCDCNTSTSCECAEVPQPSTKEHYMIGDIYTTKGTVPVVSTTLTGKDKLGACKVRMGIQRETYRITPGLYAIGAPNNESPVLVSANYKLTFDALRKEISGLDCWLLILDTKGVNVWCSAGKGTFGTSELVQRVKSTGLASVVSNQKLILPQLGAPGVSAHEVKKQTGFTVVYGPVRAKDIKAFIADGFHATDEMREVRFTIRDRAVLTPVELISAAKIALIVFGVMFLLNLFLARPFGLSDFTIYIAGMLTGTVLTPVLLPFIPGRAFAWKGWLLGFIVTAFMIWGNNWFALSNILLILGYLLAIPSYSAFLAMNFTGSSTYTSFSGVIKEMKAAVPFIVITIIGGAVLVLIKGISG